MYFVTHVILKALLYLLTPNTGQYWYLHFLEKVHFDLKGLVSTDVPSGN